MFSLLTAMCKVNFCPCLCLITGSSVQSLLGLMSTYFYRPFSSWTGVSQLPAGLSFLQFFWPVRSCGTDQDCWHRPWHDPTESYLGMFIPIDMFDPVSAVFSVLLKPSCLSPSILVTSFQSQQFCQLGVLLSFFLSDLTSYSCDPTEVDGN